MKPPNKETRRRERKTSKEGRSQDVIRDFFFLYLLVVPVFLAT